VADASKINVNGWQQGSVLPEALVKQLAAEGVPHVDDTCLLVVLTQDCDLVHASYETEPNVELIAGTLLQNADNSLRHGRNPRRLHLDIEQNDSKAPVGFSVHKRLVVPRSLLESHKPHDSLRLGRDERRLLCEWVAKRYVRAAFPDAFNERAQAAYRKIEKELKRSGEHVTGLFLMIDPDEERDAGESYRVVLRVVALGEALSDANTEITLVRVAKAIADALASCDGILVEDHQLVSEGEFSLEDLRFFKRWDWDYRSHSGEPGGEIVALPR
jgi:hypothetical protein